MCSEVLLLRADCSRAYKLKKSTHLRRKHGGVVVSAASADTPEPFKVRDSLSMNVLFTHAFRVMRTIVASLEILLQLILVRKEVAAELALHPSCGTAWRCHPGIVIDLD